MDNRSRILVYSGGGSGALAFNHLFVGSTGCSGTYPAVWPYGSFYNHIVYDNDCGGLDLGTSGGVEHNLAWANHGGLSNFMSNSSNDDPGPNDIEADPRFEDAAGGDFHLREFSPAVDAGNPVGAYNEVDGSQNSRRAVARREFWRICLRPAEDRTRAPSAARARVPRPEPRTPRKNEPSRAATPGSATRNDMGLYGGPYASPRGLPQVVAARSPGAGMPPWRRRGQPTWSRAGARSLPPGAHRRPEDHGAGGPPAGARTPEAPTLVLGPRAPERP